MLIDNKEHFVELCVDNLLWGNLKIDYSGSSDPSLAQKIVRLSGDMAKWIRIRENHNTDEFKKLTDNLYFNLVGARFSNTLHGELRDRDSENRIKELEGDNNKLVETVVDQKKKLDQIYMESPEKKNIRGIS